jgi:hypothetical protein
MTRSVFSGCFLVAILAAVACQSAATRGGDSGNPAPVYIPRPASHDEEITLIRADSEVFAAVVRAQLRAGDDEYPYHIDELRYDPRPYGSRDGYPELSAGVQGAAPELYFARAGQDAIDQIVSNRKIVLEERNVPEVRGCTRAPAAAVAPRNGAPESDGCARGLSEKTGELCDRRLTTARPTRRPQERARYPW